MNPTHWLHYNNTDHRSGAWIMARIADQAEHAEECRGRRRLLLLALGAWGLAAGLTLWFSTL